MTMFMRFVQFKIKSNFFRYFKDFFQQEVIPPLKATPGCHFVGLIQGTHQPEECVFLTLWQSFASAEAFEKSQSFSAVIEKARPYLAESAEWKVQLGRDMRLEYRPTPEEPVFKQLSVTEGVKAPEEKPGPAERIHVRIVAARIQRGKMAEFRRLYRRVILTSLKKTPGCRFAFLTENLQEDEEILSITIWDSLADARNYESSGQFGALVRRVQHTFAGLYRWKMALEKDHPMEIVTTADLTVSHYNLVTGQRFS